MQLDPRIIKGKKPLSCLETEEAKQFIGKEGYFTDCLAVFTTIISRNQKCMLTAIDEKAQSCFKDDAGGVKWDYFLPAEWVKESEKKYRPFTNEEFLALFDSGKLHSIRKKNEKGRYIITDIYFNDDYENDTVFVLLNHCDAGVGMRYLANNGYEYFDGEDWQPFGVEE